MPSLNTAFFAGALGGISPELARYLVRAQNGQLGAWFEKLVAEPLLSILVPVAVSIVILLLLGLLGGIVAHFGNEPNIGKAFMLGIGAPAFVLSTVGASGQGKEVVKDTPVRNAGIEYRLSPTDGMAWAASFFGTAAHAQTLPPISTLPTLTFDTKALPGNCAECRVVFQDSSGSVLSSAPVGSDTATTVEVPSTATIAIISGIPDTNSAQFSLESLAGASGQADTQPLSVEITKSRNFSNDFKYLLGNSAIEPFDLQLKATAAE
jgi:hypothetical protein